MTTPAAPLAGGSEPISITLTLPFSLYGWSFFGAILLGAALIGAAAWLAHLWATRERWVRALVARMDRLGLARRDADDRPALHGATWLLLALAPFVAALMGLAIIAAFSLLIVAIRGAPAVPAGGSGVMSSAGAAGVLIVAILGAPFVIWRAIVAQKTVNVAEQGMITDRINKAVEGLGAEKTVKQVIETPRYRKGESGDWMRDDEGRLVVDKGPDGADFVDRETVERTAPNLEVRIGAIYALERIAQDSLRDHIQIMEILCAYIRENAPASQAKKLPEPPEFDVEDIDGWKDRLDAWEQEHGRLLAKGGFDEGPVRPREDIQVALGVIGRRGARQRARESGDAPAFEDAVGAYPSYPVGGDAASMGFWLEEGRIWQQELDHWRNAARPFRLDLRSTNLMGADLSRGRFDYAIFIEARLDGANLTGAGLIGANLTGARLSGADLTKAGLNGAFLLEAVVSGADLTGAGLIGANLTGAGLNGANLIEARFNGANLYRARLDGANLTGAGHNGANLTGAGLNGANLYGVEFNGANLIEAGLNGADLTDAEFNGADLFKVRLDRSTTFTNAEASKAAVKDVDLSEVALSREQIVAMFGDGSVTLPGGVTPAHPNWPAHWPKEALEWREFDERWRAWQAEGGVG